MGDRMTLQEQIESLERRIEDMRTGRRRKDNQLYSQYVGRLYGLKHRRENWQDLQVEIAKHMRWESNDAV
jgi:hypothetical protein